MKCYSHYVLHASVYLGLQYWSLQRTTFSYFQTFIQWTLIPRTRILNPSIDSCLTLQPATPHSDFLVCHSCTCRIEQTALLSQQSFYSHLSHHLQQNSALEKTYQFIHLLGINPVVSIIAPFEMGIAKFLPGLYEWPVKFGAQWIAIYPKHPLAFLMFASAIEILSSLKHTPLVWDWKRFKFCYKL
jgi:hypothetical protein